MHAAYLAASPTSKGILLMLAAIALFTGMDAIAKGLVAEYPTLQVVWARYTGQTVLVALWLAPRLRQLLRTRYPKMQALRSAFQFGATAFFFFSIGWIGLAEATDHRHQPRADHLGRGGVLGGKTWAAPDYRGFGGAVRRDDHHPAWQCCFLAHRAFAAGMCDLLCRLCDCNALGRAQ